MNYSTNKNESKMKKLSNTIMKLKKKSGIQNDI